MSLCPNKSSKEWKVLIVNLKLYMIEMDMYKDDKDVEEGGTLSFIRLGTGEIPNPVQGMRLLIKDDERKKKRFEEYLTHSQREDNQRWRVKSLPKELQERFLKEITVLTLKNKSSNNNV